MAYAFPARCCIPDGMPQTLASTNPALETVGELRELYRAAESRAARMRLLSNAGKILSEAQPSALTEALGQCAEKLAFFLGARSAELDFDGKGGGVAICAPGSEDPLAFLLIDGFENERDVADEEDRETFRLFLEFMGSALDRARREEERQQLVETLRERERRLETLVERIFDAQERERIRVSQELHDGVAQTATALARMIEGPGKSASDMPAVERVRLAGIARDLVRELRSVIAGLRPTLLDDLGLEAAVRALAEGLEDDGYQVRLNVSGQVERQSHVVETALFRVAQEAISNIRKHAGGTCAVRIDLVLAPDAPARYLRVADTGRGSVVETTAPAAPGQQIGIDVMSERMAAIGGKLEWRAVPGGGVVVTAFLPGAAAA